eukprot:6667738-Alexandrium_andersonii.AAC.1
MCAAIGNPRNRNPAARNPVGHYRLVSIGPSVRWELARANHRDGDGEEAKMGSASIPGAPEGPHYAPSLALRAKMARRLSPDHPRA